MVKVRYPKILCACEEFAWEGTGVLLRVWGTRIGRQCDLAHLTNMLQGYVHKFEDNCPGGIHQEAKFLFQRFNNSSRWI